LASQFVGLILSYIIAPRHDKIGFDLQKARELFSFGKWILGRDILTYVMNQADKIVVGRLAGVATLGLYNVAYQIATLTNKELVRVVARVTFPAYSKLRSDGEIMREAYLKVVQLTSLITLPIAIGMLLLADGLVRHVLGNQWLPTVNTLRILSLWAALESLSLIAVPLLSGMGRPDVAAKTSAVRLVLLMALIYPLTKWVGMPGAALAVAMSSAVVAPWLWLSSLSMVKSNLWQLVKAMAPALFATAAMAITVLLLRETVLAPSSLARFVALGIVGGLAYVGALASWAVLFRWNPVDLLKLAPGKDEPDLTIQQSTAD
jgi:O-antigen/teichoic acid export membrane protein